MAYDSSNVPVAYQEDGSALIIEGLAPNHLSELEYAEPSPIMLFAQRWWRRTVFALKASIILGMVGAYPAATILSHHIDDSAVILNAEQNWASPQAGVAITKIARELEGGGWAGDKANWHPQARLTAMPAWQSATVEALAEHTRLMSAISSDEDAAEPDADLSAAARLLQGVPGDDMRPRLVAAAEALNRYDGRVARGLAQEVSRRDALIVEARLFAGWAAFDRAELSEQINQETVSWPAGRADISAFYAAKARGHVAHEMLVAAVQSDPELTRIPSVDAPLRKAEAAWARAGKMRPFVVSNQSGNASVMSNHLAEMAYHMVEAEEASLALAAAIEALPQTADDSVATVDIASTSPAP